MTTKKKPTPGRAVVNTQKLAAGKIPAEEKKYILVETLGNDKWAELQQWAADNQIFVNTSLIDFKTAIPYDIYEQWIASANK